jgi:hypothetical protein
VIWRQEAVQRISISGPDSVIYVESGRLSVAAQPEFNFTADGSTIVHRCVRIDLSGRPVSQATAC